MNLARPTRDRALRFESLEQREVLSAGVTATLTAAGTLSVVGTDLADDIDFVQSSGRISIAGVTGSWTAKSVKSIVVDLGGGDDQVSLASTANGGNQALKENIAIRSGEGQETVRLANSHDVYFGEVGHTLAVSNKGIASLDGAVLNFASSVVTSLKSGLLTVTGTNGDNVLLFRQSGGAVSIDGVSGSWPIAKVKHIVVNLQDGNDYVSLDSPGAERLQPPVTIRSGNGNHTVMLAGGHLVEFSGLGHTLTVAADGSVKLDGDVVVTGSPTGDPPPADWFEATIQDAELRALGATLFVDGSIDRADMLALFQNAQDGSRVDALELAGLRAIVGNSDLFGLFDYVWKLASYVVDGSSANARYQGAALGNLAIGSTDAHLTKLVNKWFLGLDRPQTSYSYRQFSGALFRHGIEYTDINQGYVGDCYLMVALAEAAQQSPSTVTNMFIVNGDGTYTVRFYRGSAAEYVTVDSYLPTDSSGYLVYAGLGRYFGSSSTELWVPLAEKAYVQLHEMGWVRPGLPKNGQNSYLAISGGYLHPAMQHVMGQSTHTYLAAKKANNFTAFVAAYNAGEAIAFGTKAKPPNRRIVGGHAYSVVGYSASTQRVTLYNPWGPEFGTITLSWAEIQANMPYFSCTT